MRPELKEAIEGIGESFDAYKDANDARLDAIEKGAGSAELDEKLERIENDVSKFSNAKASLERVAKSVEDRIEDLESRMDEPGIKQVDRLNEQHVDLFEKAIRGQFQNSDANHELKKFEKELQAKAVTIGTAAAGGYAVPEVIARDIEKHEIELSPVSDLVKVVQTGTSDYKELLDLTGMASGWVGESGTRSETGTPQLREITPTHGELYAYPQASEWSLDDAFFSIQDWLSMSAAEEFAYQRGVAVISGNGTNKPTGMLNATLVTTADHASPLRAAAAYQYVPSAASPDAITADSLLDLVYSLNAKYKSGSRMVFNSTTAGVIRKLKDGNNQYLWAPGLQSGEPDRLLGYGTTIWEDMQDVGANTHPVAFGNFRRGYLLVVRTGLRVTVDNITSPGFVKFYMRRREGGIPLNNDAIKFLRTT